MSSDDSLRFLTTVPPGPGAWLAIDAAWPVAAAGVWEKGAWRSFVRTDGPVVESLFVAVDTALTDSGLKLPELAGYFFASGPGSILGLRTAAMALSTWRVTPGVGVKPIIAYDSLRVAALLAKRAGHGDATVFAAARRDRWNVLPPGGRVPLESDTNGLLGMARPLLRLPARDLSPPPEDARTFDPIAALATDPGVFATGDLFVETDAPDAANLANQYATWSGERHKA